MKSLQSLIFHCLFFLFTLATHSIYPAQQSLTAVEEAGDSQISPLEKIPIDTLLEILKQLLDPLNFEATTIDEQIIQIDAINNLMLTSKMMCIKVCRHGMSELLHLASQNLEHPFDKTELLSMSPEKRIQLFAQTFHCPRLEREMKGKIKAALLSIRPALDTTYKSGLSGRLKVAAILLVSTIGSALITGIVVYTGARYLSSCTTDIECIIEPLRPALLSGFGVIIVLNLFFIFI